MCIKTAIVCGSSVKVQIEPDYRRIINKIISLAISEEYRDINIEKFRDVMREQLTNQEANNEEMLIAFDNLDITEQVELIKRFCDTKPNIELPMIKSLKFEEPLKEPDYIYSEYNKIDDITLKKLIKYSKNPMERKQLQRELSSRNFMNGKHSKGKRR